MSSLPGVANDEAPLRFHWRMTQRGEQAVASRAHYAARSETGLPELDQQAAFCRAAEEVGIEGMLVNFGWHEPEPILLTAGVGLQTTRVKFIIAYRSGLICPTTFVHQINTLGAMLNGRVAINVVAGHTPEEQRSYGDYLDHDQRYDRTEEFLDICNRYWRGDERVDFEGRYYRLEGGRLNTPWTGTDRSVGPTSPELYIAGSSDAARRVATTQGTCWMMMADAPEKIGAKTEGVLRAGKSVGVRLSIVGRPTRNESLAAARELAARAGQQFDDGGVEKSFVSRTDAVGLRQTYALAEREWLTPYLWTGLVRTHGAPAVALVGSPDEIADGLMEFKAAGVTQFIISGWPKLEEMLFFGREILPRVREREAEAAYAAATQ
ncbi:MAG TPA: LLM class flavin-dependent oxidoreductase [Thermoanaerobaculia bacterium]|jgi:alkanesulfonate monooxygenase